MKIKLRLLLLTFLFNGIILQAQGGPPPPCGLTPEYICDVDEDGQIEVDLTRLYPFNFCNVPPENEQFYQPLTYYFTEEDANADLNSIPNPIIFVTSTLLQNIYRRANPINPDDYPVLVGYDPLEIIISPTPAIPTPLVECDLDNDGFTVFNLFDKRQEILSGQNNYTVGFYENLQDAMNLENRLTTPYTNTTPFLQTIYASVINGTNVIEYICNEIVELDLVAQSSCEDVEVFLVNSWTPPRPGFEFRQQLVFKNNGSSDIANGTISYTKDQNMVINNVFPYDGSDTVNLVSDGFTLDFINLEADETRVVDVILNCPASTPLGEVITCTASYTTDSNDAYPNNHNPILNELIVGSYDPNDKTESHGRTIIIDNFNDDDYLYYTIRFQNLGTAAAQNVSIEDELDSQLDISTFQNLHMNHLGGVERVGSNLTWTLNNINLPAEQDDAEGSNSYVHFKIKPKTGYTIGDIIPNNASIYFDFNTPIITNTFKTEFVEDQTLSISQFESSIFDMYPNPAKDKVTIRLNANNFGNVTVNIIDLQGKLILEQHISEENTMELDLAELQSGLYFVKLNANNKSVVKKLIIE